MNLGLIGCGRMGGALVEGALKANILEPKNILLSSKTKESAEKLAQTTGGSVAENNLQVVQDSEIVLLGCKPYQVLDILAEISPALPGNAVLVSVAAGITLGTMESASPAGTRIIRSMPNTPCMIGMGASGISSGTHANENDMAAARALLEAVGIVVSVEEDQLNAVTGLSGSGPAYIYSLIGELAKQGTAEGLKNSDALKLATRTVMGAAHMLEQTGKSPQELIDQVTSPGGTTLAGLAAMDGHGFGNSVAAGVRAATERSREIAAES
ncbi:MAG: pyrroline-5-carboxylate reductase [Akkermansiaceae bacterium]